MRGSWICAITKKKWLILLRTYRLLLKTTNAFISFLFQLGTYYWSIMENKRDFKDKVVMDVGAGTGILSFFAAMVYIIYMFMFLLP